MWLQDKTQKEELASLTQDRDRLQEQLESTDWGGEEGEGEGERQREERKGDIRGVPLNNSEVLQAIDRIKDMNLKATANVKETMEEAKVCGENYVPSPTTVFNMC